MRQISYECVTVGVNVFQPSSCLHSRKWMGATSFSVHLSIETVALGIEPSGKLETPDTHGNPPSRMNDYESGV